MTPAEAKRRSAADTLRHYVFGKGTDISPLDVIDKLTDHLLDTLRAEQAGRAAVAGTWLTWHSGYERWEGVDATAGATDEAHVRVRSLLGDTKLSLVLAYPGDNRNNREAHLTREMARDLGTKLLRWADTGELAPSSTNGGE